VPLTQPRAAFRYQLDSLGRARVAVGAIFLLRTTGLLAPLHISFLGDASPFLGWPDGSIHFAPSVPVLSAALVRVLCVVRTVAALAFTLGVAARPAGIIAGILGYLTVLQDPGRLNTTEHVLFLGTILLALTDATSACALRPSPSRSPRSSVMLMRVWIASIYLWAGVAKLRLDWIDGRTLGLFLHDGVLRPRLGAILLATPMQRAAIASAVVLAELTIACLLLWPRARRHGFYAALALHGSFEVVASPDLFGWTMAALLLALWQPVTPR
jgi:hypothetical protein